METISTILPLRRRTTRSAIPPIAALWVITAMVVPISPIDVFEDLQHQLPGLVVERAGRLVAEQDVRTLGDRARDRHALLLAAGELGRKVVEAFAQPDQPQRLRRVHRIAGDRGHQLDVLARGERGDQVVELEDEADVLAPEPGESRVVVVREIVIEEVDRAPGRNVEAAEDVEQRRLAAARRSEQDDHLAAKRSRSTPASAWISTSPRW